MKNPFHARAPTFDARAIQDTIERALASAGLSPSQGPLESVTETIRRAMAGSSASAASAPSDDSHTVIDVVARVAANDADVSRVDAPTDEVQVPGTFERHGFSNPAGTRAYKLYVPARQTDAPRPMLVMLHGCTQSADDFALGTQMNRLADRHGFLVVYPEQASHANPSTCWNWFNPQDQKRDTGEPSLIAGMVREVAARHGVDSRRIYVAGLSAGAAMAIVMGETCPELFAGVGVHSGLPYGSAHDIPSALGAMKGGRGGARPATRAVRPVPLIVFHGDRDHTVRHSNAVEIVEQSVKAHLARGGAPLTSSTEVGVSGGGRKYSRTVHAQGAGGSRIESWTLHGAGHAWSGGDARGSYTDAGGPDASAEMVRFFLALPHAGSASA